MLLIKGITLKINIIIILVLITLPFKSIHSKLLSSATDMNSTIEDSSLIVIGKIKNIKSVGNNHHAILNVESTLMGYTGESNIEVFFYGDLKKSDMDSISSIDLELRALKFYKNEYVLVFLKGGNKPYRVVNHHQGKMLIEKTKKKSLVNVPYFLQQNNKLGEIEPLEKVISVIKEKI